jgi:hypothetical protein
MCVLKSLTDYTDDGGCENGNAYISIIIKNQRQRRT